MATIRVRKAGNGAGKFRYKYRNMETKKDLTAEETRKLAILRSTIFECGNLTKEEFTEAVNKVKGIAPRVRKSVEEILNPSEKVGRKFQCEGRNIVLNKIRKAKKITINKIITDVIREEYKKHGIEHVLEVRGWKFYAHLNKEVSYLLAKELIKVVGLRKGAARTEQILAPIDYVEEENGQASDN